MTPPLALTLELARAERAEDPFGFRFSAQDYLARSDGGGFQTVRIGWSQELLADLAALRLPGRDPALAQRMGELLRRSLGSSFWSAIEVQILAAVHAGRMVALTLRFAAAELYALPWELLTLSSSGQHLGELPSVLLRYEWPETAETPLSPTSKREHGRILFVWSAAGGGVPAAAQLQALEQASRRGFLPFDRERDVLTHASCSTLVETLEAARREDAPITVLHLLAHGAASGSTFGLALNRGGSDGTAAIVDAARLRQLLAPYAGMVRLVVLSACDSGNTGALGNQLGSIAQTLHRSGFAQVVASRHPLSAAGAVRFTESFYAELLGAPSSVEAALLTARRALALDPSQLDWASLQLYSHAGAGLDSRPVSFRPYRGLLAFQPEHRRFFFGRDREIAELVEDMKALHQSREPRLIGVDGASGTGKSSVVFAGALPRLLELLGPGSCLVRMRPGGSPDAALDEALAARAPDSPVLLVVDQLEELFTHVVDPRVRQSFARRLFVLASQPSSRVSVIVTLRSDFVGRCGELCVDDSGLRLDRVIYDPAHRVSVAQMNPQQLREVMERPAERVGLQLESGLAERLLHEVNSEPGALPLLADMLDLLWQRREGRLLTLAAYEGLGGVAGALNGRADQLIAALPDAEQQQARRLLVRLGSGLADGTQGVRVRVPLRARRPTGEPEAVHFDRAVARLVEARLLVRDRDAQEETIEVAHEALLRSWPRLAEWVREDRQQLLRVDTLERWVKEAQESGSLLPADRLAYAEKVAAECGDLLHSATLQLLADSRAEQERAEERDRFARDSLRMLAVEALDYDPSRQAAILREAESADPTQVPGWLGTALHILQSHVLTVAELIGHRGRLTAAEFSPDGRRVLTTGGDGTARVWDVQGKASPIVLSGHKELLSGAVFSPDGTRIATASIDGTACVWRSEGRGEPLRLTGHLGPIYGVAWSPDGTQLATASQDGTARVWSADGREEAIVLEGHEGEVHRVAWGPDGALILTASSDGTVRLWRDDQQPVVLAGDGAEVIWAELSPRGDRVLTVAQDGTARLYGASGRGKPIVLEGPEGGTSMARFSPDGARIILAGLEGGLRLCDAQGRASSVHLVGHNAGISWVAWSPDGARIASAAGDGMVALWSADGRSVPLRLRGHHVAVVSASFSPDGRRLVTASTDGTARIWDLTRESLLRPAVLDEAPADRSFVFCAPPLSEEEEEEDAEETEEEKEKEKEFPIEAQSPDNRYRAVAAADGTVRIHGGRGGRATTLLPAAGGQITGLCFSPDGSSLLTFTEDCCARVWSVTGGAPVVLAGHAGPIRCAAFSPDGKRLLTGSEDWEARIWSCDGSGTPVILDGHIQAVLLVAWNPAGDRILTISEEGMARLWTTGGRSEVLFSAREDRPIALRKDWKQFITAGEGNLLFQWDLLLDPSEIKERLWQATPVCLSVSERERHLREPHDQAVRNHALAVSRTTAKAVR